ncbi:Gfo/Idh/MocA family protein [Truepera radiovictrix]|uniref:Oxidoreductase domain protein n=1 Tax=Truepera radiovictrix (strain DSM 17093 / CIP 108686 / LMG 22925 / RQ-24) TaxID=649638 RepID=D7CQH5_TRURR|nr:Gfo/Idh/MocA family oxidoreductase [Truepera radiovictrix]ADI14959.1 oxidoreductase domain protein [Truepera radiovictrix DSM 17093]WMT56486.1 Gfo/Idh/MocA family oxidoreductase [Truepera radiovictrix]
MLERSSQQREGVTPEGPINAALVGVSGFGRVHYGDLLRQQERGRVRLIGATVINQAEEVETCRHLQALGCRLYDDAETMFRELRGEIDLCCIPTGIHQHAPMTVAALRAGANVLVEKPAAATLGDVYAMRAAERETGGFVAVGFQSMYAPETLVMKRAILAGDIGKLRAIKCRALWPRLDSYYTRNAWAGRLKLGERWVLDSPFNNAVAHQLNMICFLAGTELHRSARLQRVEAELLRAHAIESADTASLRLLTEDGVTLHFVVTHCSETVLDPEIVVRGDRGSIHWTFDEMRLQKRDGSLVQLPCLGGTPLRDAMQEAVRARVRDPEVFVCDLGVAGTHTLAVNGAHLACPVHAIPERFVERYPAEGAIKTVVRGIEGAVARAFDEERLFSELGVPWARPGGVASLTDPQAVAAAFR